MRKEDLDAYIKLKDTVEEQASEVIDVVQEEFIEQFHKTDTMSNKSCCVCEVDVDTEGVTIKVEESWAYGGYDSSYYTVNHEHFCDLELLRKIQREKKRKYLNYQEKQKIEEEENKIQRDLEELDRLKKKYSK